MAGSMNSPKLLNLLTLSLRPFPLPLFGQGVRLQPWHGMCYKYSFVWAGVAQSGRAADL